MISPILRNNSEICGVYAKAWVGSRIEEGKQQDSNATCRAQLGGYPLNMLFLANEPAKKAEINILTARDTTGPGF